MYSNNSNTGFEGDIKTDASEMTVTTREVGRKTTNHLLTLQFRSHFSRLSQVSPWPGQNFPVSLTVRDQFDLPTSVTAQFLFNVRIFYIFSLGMCQEYGLFSTLTQVNEGGGGERVVLQPELTAITSRAEFTQEFSCVTSSQDASGTVLISNGLQSKAFQTQVRIPELYTWSINMAFFLP